MNREFIQHVVDLRRSWQRHFVLDKPQFKFPTTLRRALRRRFINEAGELNSDGRRIMRDLAQFCYANRVTAKISPRSGQIDPIAMGVAEGRREVFIRIAQALNLNDATFNRLLTNNEDSHDNAS